mmetsp:Transcript_10475/g.29918  ORF Transcript_10475/g.29918 Transcript_10475/m.29918 type:complete len:311 (-) Transcript_10475:2151-3083(-)
MTMTLIPAGEVILRDRKSRSSGRPDVVAARFGLELTLLLFVAQQGVVDGADPCIAAILGTAEHSRHVVHFAVGGWLGMTDLEFVATPLFFVQVVFWQDDGGIEHDDAGWGCGGRVPIYQKQRDVDVMACNLGRRQYRPPRLPRPAPNPVMAGALLVNPALDNDGCDCVRHTIRQNAGQHLVDIIQILIGRFSVVQVQQRPEVGRQRMPRLLLRTIPGEITHSFASLRTWLPFATRTRGHAVHAGGANEAAALRGSGGCRRLLQRRRCRGLALAWLRSQAVHHLHRDSFAPLNDGCVECGLPSHCCCCCCR